MSLDLRRDSESRSEAGSGQIGVGCPETPEVEMWVLGSIQMKVKMLWDWVSRGDREKILLRILLRSRLRNGGP